MNMYIVFVILFVFNLFTYLAQSEDVESNVSLKLLIIFFRHGARSPSRTYNSDPYKDYNWPDGWGSLTKNGKMGLYELGKQYREHYNYFIPKEYHENEVYVRSSDKSRCLMSAYTFLAGLFPPSEDQVWNPEILWQPIPVHSLPKDLDDIVAGTKPCKIYEEIYYKLLNETKEKSKYKSVYSFLSERMNETVDNVLDVNYIYSSLLAQWTEGLSLPEWSEQVFPEKLLPFYTLSLALLSYNESLLRLRVGPLLNDIKKNFEDIINNKNKRKLYIYSGHDVNLVSLWRAFGFEELLNPEYGASLAIELHRISDEDNFHVKIYLRNNTEMLKPQELRLPHCGFPCYYNKFTKHINKLIPLNWNSECQNNA